jgi:RNA polymerase sigma-70 factor (ECF subfamily)
VIALPVQETAALLGVAAMVAARPALAQSLAAHNAWGLAFVMESDAGDRRHVDRERGADMARGEEAAFTALYREYRTRLYQYALSLVRNRETAEDAVQDAFLGWVRQMAAGKAPRQTAPYLYASVRNRCLDRLRRRPEVALEEAQVELLVAPAGDEERIGLRHALNRLLLALPEEQREVVVLRTWHDLEFAAIAELQGTPLNTAIARYHYALAKLRKELDVHE